VSKERQMARGEKGKERKREREREREKERKRKERERERERCEIRGIKKSKDRARLTTNAARFSPNLIVPRDDARSPNESRRVAWKAKIRRKHVPGEDEEIKSPCQQYAMQRQSLAESAPFLNR